MLQTKLGKWTLLGVSVSLMSLLALALFFFVHKAPLHETEPPEKNVAWQEDPQAKVTALEQLGEPVETPSESGTLSTTDESERLLAQVVRDIDDCFEVENEAYSQNLPVRAESVLTHLQSVWGPSTQTIEREMTWRLQLPDKTENLVKLSVTENEGGDFDRDLEVSRILANGELEKIPMNPTTSKNPSEGVIQAWLKKGVVTLKEQVTEHKFGNSEFFQATEVNEELSQFEIVRDSTFFRCAHLKSKQACFCQK